MAYVSELPRYSGPFDIHSHIILRDIFGIAGLFWNLGLEAQFYLVFPLVIVAIVRFGFHAITALIVIFLFYHICIKIWNFGDAIVLENFFLGRWMQFGAGMAVAILVARLTQQRKALPGWQGSILLFLAIVVF